MNNGQSFDESIMGFYPATVMDPIMLEVGQKLLPLIDPEEGELLKRVASIRGQLAQELGFVMPSVNLKDNLQLKGEAYRIIIKGATAACGEVIPDRLFAFHPSIDITSLEGQPGREPSFGMKGLWIKPEEKKKAEEMGCLLFDTTTILATHLAETVKDYSCELIGLQETQNLLDMLSSSRPVIIQEIIPRKANLSLIKRILSNLLRERVSICDMATIIETLGEAIDENTDPIYITEKVRIALGRAICEGLIEITSRTITVLAFESQTEKYLASTVKRANDFFHFSLSRDILDKIIQNLREATGKIIEHGHPPVLITIPFLRWPLKRLLERYLPQLIVLKFTEIPHVINVNVIRRIMLEEALSPGRIEKEIEWQIEELNLRLNE